MRLALRILRPHCLTVSLSLSYCLTVSLSHCLIVSLSDCLTVSLSHCHLSHLSHISLSYLSLISLSSLSHLFLISLISFLSFSPLSLSFSLSLSLSLSLFFFSVSRLSVSLLFLLSQEDPGKEPHIKDSSPLPPKRAPCFFLPHCPPLSHSGALAFASPLASSYITRIRARREGN